MAFGPTAIPTPPFACGAGALDDNDLVSLLLERDRGAEPAHSCPDDDHTHLSREITPTRVLPPKGVGNPSRVSRLSRRDDRLDW